MAIDEFKFEKLTAENYHTWRFNMKMYLIETLSKEGSQKRQQKMLDIYKGQKQGRSYS